jgi:hypothetical protein
MWNEAIAIYANCLTISKIIAKVELNHCPRENNYVAHVIVRLCFTTSRSYYNWIDEPLSFYYKLS